tara:strand:+ start:571 stop:768 length:198 start_codon:yes stop_codon:yes gene_type:complete
MSLTKHKKTTEAVANKIRVDLELEKILKTFTLQLKTKNNTTQGSFKSWVVHNNFNNEGKKNEKRN